MTVFDVISKIRIIGGQTVFVQREDETLAWYQTHNEAMASSDSPVMKLPVDLIGWIGKQMILYVR